MSTPGASAIRAWHVARRCAMVRLRIEYVNARPGARLTAPLDKAQKLIALALGTHSTEEARTTALIAVRLIAEHKLLSAPAPAGDPFDWFREGVRKQRERERAPNPPPPKPKYGYGYSTRPAPDGCAWIKAKFDATCLFCGEATRTGESVLWEKGNGVIHEDCFPAAEAEAKERGTL